MQKYWLKVSINDESWMGEAPPSEFEDQQAYYRTQDADARIEQLERALRSCRRVLKLQRQAVQNFSGAADEAIDEADGVLHPTT